MSEHLFLYELKILMIVIVVLMSMQLVQNLNVTTISVQLIYAGVVILVGSSLSMKKLKQFSQKMNMKKLFHSIYLSKHLIMALQRVTVDTEQGSNLLILLNISMIN